MNLSDEISSFFIVDAAQVVIQCDKLLLDLEKSRAAALEASTAYNARWFAEHPGYGCRAVNPGEPGSELLSINDKIKRIRTIRQNAHPPVVQCALRLSDMQIIFCAPSELPVET